MHTHTRIRKKKNLFMSSLVMEQSCLKVLQKYVVLVVLADATSAFPCCSCGGPLLCCSKTVGLFTDCTCPQKPAPASSLTLVTQNQFLQSAHGLCSIIVAKFHATLNLKGCHSPAFPGSYTLVEWRMNTYTWKRDLLKHSNVSSYTCQTFPCVL